MVKEFQADLPPVLGNKNKLEQVFIDLLIDCGESMGGEGRLTVVTSVRLDGEMLQVCFRDTGLGILESYLSCLFVLPKRWAELIY